MPRPKTRSRIALLALCRSALSDGQGIPYSLEGIPGLHA